MKEDQSPIALAREASALTLDDAAMITGMSKVVYQRIEERPFEMTIGEMRALCSELNKDGRAVIFRWMETFFEL